MRQHRRYPGDDHRRLPPPRTSRPRRRRPRRGRGRARVDLGGSAAAEQPVSRPVRAVGSPTATIGGQAEHRAGIAPDRRDGAVEDLADPERTQRDDAGLHSPAAASPSRCRCPIRAVPVGSSRPAAEAGPQVVGSGRVGALPPVGLRAARAGRAPSSPTAGAAWSTSRDTAAGRCRNRESRRSVVPSSACPTSALASRSSRAAVRPGDRSRTSCHEGNRVRRCCPPRARSRRFSRFGDRNPTMVA